MSKSSSAAKDPRNGAAKLRSHRPRALGEKSGPANGLIARFSSMQDDLNMRYNFACVLSIMRDTDAALKMLERVLALAGPGPSDPRR